jgi:hypothetical protein
MERKNPEIFLDKYRQCDTVREIGFAEFQTALRYA